MNRIALMVLRNAFKAPGLYMKLRKYAKTVGTYPEAEAYAHIRKILTLGVESGNIRMQVTGQENIPTEGGFLLYSNHQGLFDVVSIVVGCETPISAVYKKEIENIPFINEIATCLKGLAMDRKDPRQSLQVIQEVTKEVMAGRRYIIFPEGTRSKKGNVPGEFKGGTFKSAMKAKASIVPVALIDSFKPFDIKDTGTVSVQIHYLEPIYYEEYKDMKTLEIASLVKSRIVDKIEKETGIKQS